MVKLNATETVSPPEVALIVPCMVVPLTLPSSPKVPFASPPLSETRFPATVPVTLSWPWLMPKVPLTAVPVWVSCKVRGGSAAGAADLAGPGTADVRAICCLATAGGQNKGE